MNYKRYYYVTLVQLFFTLIAGGSVTWMIQNNDGDTVRYHPQIWATFQFIAFAAWSSFIISGSIVLLFWTGVWDWFIKDENERTYFLVHMVYIGIYDFFWLGGAASLSTIPGNCRRIDHCTSTRAAAASSWLTFFALSWASVMIIREWFYGSYKDQTIPMNTKQAKTKAPPPPPMSTTNSQMLERLCIQCSHNQSAIGSVFCGPQCVLQARAGAPKLMVLPAAHYMFRTVSDLFRANWTHPTAVPTLQYIFVIVSTEEYDRMYRAYREGVDSVGKFQAQGLKEGNEQYRWHGTSRECKVGDPGHPNLCTSASCSLCSIIRYSFDIDRFGPRWGRFGKGIYTSGTSSKSNDYQKNLQPSQWSALLLNNVVVGRGYQLYDNSDKLIQPPPGYDSVLGVPGRALNYDETVVYRNDAIRPAYLVLYLTPQ